MKTLLKILSIPIIALTLRLAYQRGESIYHNLTTSDKHVDARCGMALSEELFCWCYEEYDRICPLDARAKDAQEYETKHLTRDEIYAEKRKLIEEAKKISKQVDEMIAKRTAKTSENK